MQRWIWLFIFTLSGIAPAGAQIEMLSGPARKTREVGLAFDGEYSFADIFNDHTRLLHASLRPTLLLSRTYALYGILGLVRQKTEFRDSRIGDYASDYARQYGGGLLLSLPLNRTRSVRLYVHAQARYFKPAGDALELLRAASAGYKKRHDIVYAWEQQQLDTGFSVRVRRLLIVGSAYYRRDEATHDTNRFLVSPENTIPVGTSSGLFFRRTRIGAHFGLFLTVPGDHRIGMRVFGSGKDDLSIAASISQIGAPN